MTGALSLLAGVLVGLMSTRLPPAAWLSGAFALVALVWLTPLRVAPAPRRLALLLGGMVLACVPLARWAALHVPAREHDERVLLEGRILSVPAHAGGEYAFDAQVSLVSRVDRRARLARLRWRVQAPPRVGERWRLLVRLERADALANFHGFDAARLAFRDGIQLHGRVLPSALNSRLMLAHDSVNTLRARIAVRIAARIADPDAAGLVTALAVGLTGGMSTDQWRVFNATGTTHLVAISGLHVTLFALLAFALARLLWRALPARLGIGREPFALLTGLTAAGGYALLAGFSVPTQRTWLMLGAFVLARLAARPVGAARTWSLALIAVLLLDPLAPLAAGFWLSFVAVGVILVLETTALRPARGRLRFLGMQFAVMLALAPLTFAVFGGVSLVGVVVNLLAIPVISFVLVPVVLAGVLAAWWAPAFDAIPFGVAAKLYEWLWPGMVWAADLGHATWRTEPQAWWFVLAIPAVLLLMRRWPWGLRLGGVAVLLPLLFVPPRLPPGGALVHVFDAGRGTAVLIATRRHSLLVDTGDSWNTHGTVAPRVILPALDALGIRRVDVLVLPRLDADRAAGAALLAFERDVGEILVGGGWPATSLPVARCRDSIRQWGALRLQTFAARGAGMRCALRVSVNGHSLLLPGDLDDRAERDLLSRLPPGALASEVVLLGRQAGAPVSAAKWIEASGAALAIATGGIAQSAARSRFLQRWRDAGVRVLDTRVVGGIQFAFGTRDIEALAVARRARYPFLWRRVE
ncbi:MAG TPA: DNA internalization-related competence protein ComEC/Rec2 [Steroidobacteraceae bacterium]|nr:DNA internalization-related competence protein ComEC/Rec2 [Steroidobacteraceae bacterium]